MSGSVGDSTSLYGVPLDRALAQRERHADDFDIDFGEERVFPGLVEFLLDEVTPEASVLEVGAASGLLTRPLLERAGRVTALEPSAGLLRRLLSSSVADSPKLLIRQGMVEDLSPDKTFDVAVVTFTPRRGVGLSRLLVELGLRVKDKIVLLLDDDNSMDWAYLARAAAVQGFDVSLRILSSSVGQLENRRRAVLLVVNVSGWEPADRLLDSWALDASEVRVPYPTPRGEATRLVRYFLAGGDRAMRVSIDQRGEERLYGNLRTAVHRLARENVTVRRSTDGIQIVRLPKGTEGDTVE